MNKVVRKLISKTDLRMFLKWTITSNFSTVSNYGVPVAKNLLKNNEILDIEIIMRNIEQDYKNINAKVAVKAVNALYENFQKSKKLDPKIVTNSEVFENICKVILKDIKSLSRYDTINILQVLLFFNVPTDSLLIQSLFQMIRVSLNNLTVGQIMILYNMLYKIEKTSPLSESLLHALRHVFKHQAEIELNSDSTNLLQVLKFCSMINDFKVKRQILMILCNNHEKINLNNVITIFDAIYSLPKLDSFSKQLLIYIQNMILTNYRMLNFDKIEYLLRCISKKVLDSEMEFYNEKLIDKLCSQLSFVLSSNITFHQNLIILKHLNNMHYSNISLLDCLIEKCLKDINILERCSINDIDTFIKGFIIADYMPNNWETVVSRMLQNFMINLDCSIYNTVFTVFCLLSLNSYHPELIEKAFTLYNKFFYEKNSVLFGKDITLTILRLYWCVKLLYPEYKGFMPDENKLNQIKMEHEYYEVPYLMNSLKEVVGGIEYMKSGLKTKFGEFVDYVVVIQPDGSFMNISNYDNIIFVEELVSLSECSKILFFAFPIKAYSINKRNLLSTVKIQLKAIETLSGFHSFVINPYLWRQFSNEERILHIQNIIKLKQ
ncbi:hypothetical protein E2986_00738 [Frieseomelitta varia]|uniref:RAP domain-containing protein n=2 Tax=Frieseomelitta varia TaxID=561572 RepID=A0A833SBW8_9HYME|nr:hypothetical protein E2986_00738 [Frieseomelitta varia]